MTRFADTSVFLASMLRRDPAHAKATAALRDVAGPLVTTTWVLVELGNSLSRPPLRLRYYPYVSALLRARNLVLVHPDVALFRQAMDLYDARPDKAWSMTDCLSFVVMSRDGIREALTTDRHFEQAGFVALIK